MDTCQEFAALLDLYVDGALPPAEAERVQAHLETCDVCRSYVDDIQAIRAAFPRIEDTPVPEDFADGVMAAIRAGTAPQKKRPAARWTRIALPLAACLAIFAVVQVPLLQRDTAADQAAEQQLIQDTSDAASDQEHSRQETAEADEPQSEPAESESPAAEEDTAPETGTSQTDTFSRNTSPQVSTAYSLPKSGDDSSTLRDTAPSVESTRPPVQAITQAPLQTANGSDAPQGEEPQATSPIDESSAGDADDAPVFAVLSLSAAQAGSLPEEITPVSTGADGSVCYHLTPAQYDALLSALTEQGETPEPSLSVPENREAAGAYAVVTVDPA